MTITTINEQEIIPIGNFKEVLESLRTRVDKTIAKTHELKKYHSGIADDITIICNTLGMIDVLEEGYEDGETWDIKENLQCLLYTHLLIIDLNQTAHTYLNNITEWDSRMDQLQELIDSKPKIYKGLKIC